MHLPDVTAVECITSNNDCASPPTHCVSDRSVLMLMLSITV